MADPLIQWVMALSLTLLLLTAAVHKLTSVARFAAQLRSYELLPAGSIDATARILPAFECLIAALLLLPATRAVGGLAAALMFAVYGLAMFANLLRGRRELDCGCGGEPQPISGWLILRNALLVCVGLALAAPIHTRALGFADAVSAVLLTALVALTYALYGQLIRNQTALVARSRGDG